MPERVFGEVAGVKAGDHFDDRKELSVVGIHRPLQAGISGSATEGADSIVLSGGYEDDEDYGTVIVYTGHGGRDPNSGRQTSDQTFTSQNAALGRNKVLGLPVRVVRGYQMDSSFAPPNGYRYDGLYRVDEYWEETGRSGYKVWRYRLIKSDDSSTPTLKPGAEPPKRPARREFTTTRVVRDTAMSRRVKEVYDYTCQVCGTRLDTPAGPYAEGAHIKPLGIPHNGPDVESNILCLCPNHHVLFDDGAITLTDELRVIGLIEEKKLTVKHTLGTEYIRYHREHFGALIQPSS